MAKHILKTENPYFSSVWSEIKKFEVRKNDRDFKIGDTLVLKEYDKSNDSYTGRYVEAEVTYVLNGGNFGIDKDYCILSIRIYKWCEGDTLKSIKDEVLSWNLNVDKLGKLI